MDEKYDNVNNEMEDALRRLGKGGEIEETHVEEIFDPETGNVRQVKRRRTVKTVRPDYRALIFWLSNRMPKNWTGKTSTEQEWHDEDWHGVSDETEN